MWEVIVDKDKCAGDEECVNACPAQVYEMVDGKADAVEPDARLVLRFAPKVLLLSPKSDQH